MKKLIAFICLAGILTFGATTIVNAQNGKKAETVKEQTAPAADEQQVAAAEETPAAAVTEEVAAESKSFHQVLKEKFIEGGAEWMAPILIVLILGLTLCIERIIYLGLSSTNSEKLLNNVEAALKNGGVEAAKEVCRNARGPVASIFYQGLDRADEGVEMMEKAIVSYGGVAMGRLEKNLTWIAYVIAVAPMLGFLGTVVGMVLAFDQIEAAGDISPTVVAGGMKVALLTTVFGLIVAILIQTFYNYLSSKIESIVNTMEDASISFMDIIVKHYRK